MTEFLGRQKVFRETKRRTSDPGVSTGLAWTPAGGDILFIEARAMPGSGQLMLTGQLGDVMKESAQAALTYVRSIADRLGAEPEFFQKHDIHVHVPAGAVPKDGPSAGVAMTVALASMVSGRPVDAERGHDRRGDPHRAGAAGGRHQGEGARGPGGRHHPRVPARPQRGGRGRDRGDDLLTGLQFTYVDHVDRCSTRPSRSPRMRPAAAPRRRRPPDLP